jgi:hypothetical protein
VTVFIGHDDSGKPSVIAALETYLSIFVDGLEVVPRRRLGAGVNERTNISVKRDGHRSGGVDGYDLRYLTRLRPVSQAADNDPGGQSMSIEALNQTEIDALIACPKRVINPSSRPKTEGKHIRRDVSVRQSPFYRKRGVCVSVRDFFERGDGR